MHHHRPATALDSEYGLLDNDTLTCETMTEVDVVNIFGQGESAAKDVIEHCGLFVDVMQLFGSCVVLPQTPRIRKPPMAVGTTHVGPGVEGWWLTIPFCWHKAGKGRNSFKDMTLGCKLASNDKSTNTDQ